MEPLPIRTRTRYTGQSPAEIRIEVLTYLSAILEYSQNRLLLLTEVTEDYARGLGTGGFEYFFPFAKRRRGTFLQVLIVLRRLTRNQDIRWDQHGEPISGTQVVDRLKESTGKIWWGGFRLDSISPILTPAKPFRVEVDYGTDSNENA